MPEVSEDSAGEFVLGALEADELVAVERRMRDEPDFRRAVEAWSRRLAPLLEQVPPKTPPVSAWSAIRRRMGRYRAWCTVEDAARRPAHRRAYRSAPHGTWCFLPRA